MQLQLFDFIEEVMEYLDSLESEINVVYNEIEEYFKEILKSNSEEVLNINSRVKSPLSLKEKILRNNYYQKYESPEELLLNLSDLIGVRIECRFIEDERKIYEVLKKHFNKKLSDGYYCNPLNEKISLELTSTQPQQQKNGFEIYRIDGLYKYNNKTFNFELQIKSLVNIFWGEIEHKVIYKNNNYMVWDGFFKDIMGSIKKNLTMIDNQLLLIYNQFNKLNTVDTAARIDQLEKLLSKIIYEIFSVKIKDSIGFTIDFRKSCDTIMRYIFRTNNAENLEDYNKTLLKTLARLKEIGNNDINFNREIQFERDVLLDDEFSKIMGSTILNLINSDFQCNVFFTILFEIELGNNAEDFETFIKFIGDRFKNNDSFLKLYASFEETLANNIAQLLIIQIAHSFTEIKSIHFLDDNSIEAINKVTDKIIQLICENITSNDDWCQLQDIYLELFNLKILSVLDWKIGTAKVTNLIKKIKNYSNKNIGVRFGALEYMDKMETLDEIEANEVLKLFKTM
ncbi:GTP pyrophosphokinase [Clostridiisalibacter paucivorans]|uniref:GTP pyrophosphokinase n=1 Tax=Clostridiisalibacter paucivorans TaxID=408753 RepID=UPI000686000C|nr:hypothetical protein [Clostridiisalibacter paucivorans]